jgi:hypothetical protein
MGGKHVLADRAPQGIWNVAGPGLADFSRPNFLPLFRVVCYSITVRRLLALALGLMVLGLVSGDGLADVYTLTDGAKLEGEIVSVTEKGAILRLPDGAYSDRVAWERFSQDDLKTLARNSKYGRYVQGLIIEDELEVARKKPARPSIVVKPVENRLETPDNPALIGGFFGSSVGWLVLLALYAANLWAAYEIAIFRAQSVGLVCGLAAVVPVLPQIVFLSMPTRMPKEEPAVAGEAAGAGAEGAVAEQKFGANLKVAYEAPPAEDLDKAAAPTIFKRGDFMFNRRFFETRFTNFFGLVRRDKDKHSILVIKSSRGEYTARRISRISANDMHLEIAKGPATEEVSIPFVEIQEVQLRQEVAR